MANFSQKVIKLHLKLDQYLDEESFETLRKYGKVKNEISRDILVPGDILLRNLHYAIQRAFGWQNCHLHNFSYDESVFNELTQENAAQWLRLCGIYFLFNGLDQPDLDWDNDFDDSMDIRKWLKEKYTGPYIYYGLSENYIYSHLAVNLFKNENASIPIGPSFEEYRAGKRGRVDKKLEDVTVFEIERIFQSSCQNLLERLPLSEVIGLRKTRDAGKKVADILNAAEKDFPVNDLRIKQLRKRVEKDGVYPLFEAFCETNPKVVPLSNKLIYEYDYGDGWQVEITCTDIYDLKSIDDFEPFTLHIFDSKGKELEGDFKDQVQTVIFKHKPICIAADGLPVFDDVGGFFGYISFLNGINGNDCGGFPYEDKDDTLEWAKSLGWTGKMRRIENIL